MAYPEIPERKGKMTGYGVVAPVLFVMLILACLSTSGPSVTAAWRAKAANTVTQIETAYLAYYTEYGEWPQATENAQLIRILEGENERKIAFLSLRSSGTGAQGRVIDPWGTPFQIKVRPDFKLRVTSAGRDKIFATADDIGDR
jgi:hypothetical protein